MTNSSAARRQLRTGNIDCDIYSLEAAGGDFATLPYTLKILLENLLRREDGRYLSGKGRFIADMRFPGMLEMAFYRSPAAHARIGRQPFDARVVRAEPHVPFDLGVNYRTGARQGILCALATALRSCA